ncbi:MAG: hypothetical protein AB1414_14675 [bacterium]
MGKRSLKENSRGTGIKTIMCSIAVMCVLLGSSTIAQGIEWQWPWLKAKEQKTKQEQVVKKKNLQLRPKQIGTPTVQALLDKVKANYQKIQDLKADVAVKLESKPLPPMFPTGVYSQKEKWYFKAPDKIKEVPPNEKRTIITKNNTEYTLHLRWGKWEIDSDPLYWYYLLEPGRFDFYWRLDEIMTKFDTKVISHSEENIWVIEAVPKESNPEDDYNYPTGATVELWIDYNMSVIKKINCWSRRMERYTEQTEITDFELIDNIWIPRKFVKIQPPLPKYRPDETREEYILSNIQINTGIPDSEFEF